MIHSEMPCRICAGHELQVIATQGRNFQTLTTVICTGCGLIHSYPIPSKQELDEYYSKQYRSEYKGAYTPKRKHILRYSRGAKERLNKLLAFVGKDKKLLDVGSGSGEFVYGALLAGFDVAGLEPHAGYSDYTRTTFGVPIITAPLEKAQIAPESYDVITLNHVLEHLQDPLASLSYLNGWLKMGGVLVVEVPDIEHTQHSPVNRFHFAHIYNFNHDTLKAMLEKSGFTIDAHQPQKGTALFARKTGEPQPERMIAMPENYLKLLHLMSKEVASERYQQKKPIKRFLHKFYRYPREFIHSIFLWHPQSIVRYELSK
jgi:SAM-dependent methyltransferase